MPKKRKLPQPNGRAPLQPNHQLFLDRYMTHWKGARAAREAGFSPRSAGSIAHVLLNRDDIHQELIARRSAMAENLQNVSDDRIQHEIARVAMADMSDFAPMLGDRSPAEQMQYLTRDQSAAIKEIVVEEFRDGRSDHRNVRRTRFKLHDKHGPLELLAKIKGMVTERVDHKHQHQHLVLVQLLDEIDVEKRGKPIVPALAAPKDNK